MFQLLHLRSRPCQTLLIGLVIFTFYVYNRTITDQVHQFPVNHNSSHTSSREEIHPHGNFNTDSQIAATLKNLTLEPSGPGTNVSHNPSNLSTIITMVSMSSSSQTPSSPSTSANLKNNSQTLKNTKDVIMKIVTPTGDNSSVPRRDSARAIYEAGHSIEISEKCPFFGRDMDLVIIVMSAPARFEARTAIRQTWGHFGQRTDISILFILGTTSNGKIEKSLQKEQKTYGDVIRGKFVDTYSNLTLKTISILEWVDVYCSEVKFILKTDDDMFINVPRLLSFIDKHKNDKRVIFGRLARKWKPIRNIKSKYYVSRDQYNSSVFPDFTTGPAYLLSSDIVHDLYEGALDQTYLKLEDVFTTGIVAQKLGIKRSQANEFLNKRISYSPCNIQKGISIHMVKYSEQFDLWKKLLDGKSKCT